VDANGDKAFKTGLFTTAGIIATTETVSILVKIDKQTGKLIFGTYLFSREYDNGSSYPFIVMDLEVKSDKIIVTGTATAYAPNEKSGQNSFKYNSQDEQGEIVTIDFDTCLSKILSVETLTEGDEEDSHEQDSSKSKNDEDSHEQHSSKSKNDEDSHEQDSSKSKNDEDSHEQHSSKSKNDEDSHEQDSSKSKNDEEDDDDHKKDDDKEDDHHGHHRRMRRLMSATAEAVLFSP
jgi:cobalamin biosynthesis protein CobT